MFAMNASNLHSQSHQPPHFHGKDLQKLRVNHACQVEAEMADLPGSFIAMTSTPPHLLPHALQDDLPVINSKVLTFITHWYMLYSNWTGVTKISF